MDGGFRKYSTASAPPMLQLSGYRRNSLGFAQSMTNVSGYICDGGGEGGPMDFMPGATTNLMSDNSLVSKVEIHISCSNLQNRDYLSKSDPMVVMFVEVPKNDEKEWREYDRTETIKDDLNPRFVKSFVIEYYFEIHQKLKFEVYDKDSSSDDLKHHDFLGMIEVSLGSIIGERGSVVTKQLVNKRKQLLKSKISFTAEELLDSKEMITLQFKGKKLERKDLFSASDPYLRFSRCGIEENNEYTPVYKTHYIKNEPNPIWPKFSVPVTTLCNGDKHRPIRIECFSKRSMKDSLIGSCETSINDLLRGGENAKMLINEKKQKKKNYRHSGILVLHYIELQNKSSFLDYISNGLQLCFHVAVDFTASNGNPMHPSSLHYLHDFDQNQYAQALYHVGRICEDYDSDKLISAYGFGAKIKGEVSHSFPLNFNMEGDPNCEGIEGVLRAYQSALPRVELFGPTNFSPVLNVVMKMAEAQTSYSKYHILLILTDGLISDMGQTKTALIKASKLPISVLIVGIGNANFSSMVELDSDHSLLSYLDQTAERDIVQFVPYQKYSGSFPGADLAQEVLLEIPNQLVSYMGEHGISPGMTNISIEHTAAGSKVISKSSKNRGPLTLKDLNTTQSTIPNLQVAQLSKENTSSGKIKLSAKEAALLVMGK